MRKVMDKVQEAGVVVGKEEELEKVGGRRARCSSTI